MKLRRNYRLLILLVVIVVGTTLLLGNQRIQAYTVLGNSKVATGTIDYNNQIAVFDDSIVHSIQILMDEDDYQAMLTTYQQTSEKDYFHADVIVDGVKVTDVGIRLKGNASLRTALGGMGRMAGGFNPRGDQGGEDSPQFNPDEMQNFRERQAPPDDGQRLGRSQFALPEDGQLPIQPEGAELPELPAGGVQTIIRGQGGMGQNTQIPLLICFDKFVEGQTYQGFTKIAIRSAGISYKASMLQEPITNFVFQLAGLPATDTAFAGVQLNDGTMELFTISEVIEEEFLEKYFVNPDGILYKAEVQAQLSYQGDDPSAYARSFSQETRVNDADLAPLIRFLQFLSTSDDETFDRELSGWLDVESFAGYLAVNNLLVNIDSMAGMGNNYYLYYDDSAERFTILYWDGNESLGGLAMGSQVSSFDIYYQNTGSGRMPMGTGMGMDNSSTLLVKRFLASASFTQLYEQKLVEIYHEAFTSGAIDQKIEQYAGLIRAANDEGSLVAKEDYEQSLASVLSFVTERQAYLASTPLLSSEASVNSLNN